MIDTEEYFETEHIRVGDNLTLPCPFENFDTLKWYRKGKFFNNQSTVIQINNMSTLDAGKLNREFYHIINANAKQSKLKQNTFIFVIV